VGISNPNYKKLFDELYIPQSQEENGKARIPYEELYLIS
jgi:hypothetical protein